MKLYLAVSLLTLTLLMGYFFIKDQKLYLDEYPHQKTISEIASNQINSDTFNRIAQIPGYHFTLATFSKVSGTQSFSGLRLFQTFLSLVCVVIFYLAARKLDPSPILKSALFLFL